MNDYAPIIEAYVRRYEIRVKKWRASMSGCAWRVTKADGSTINWVESPYPKTPISLSIFLHEIGHHAIGFAAYKRRCEEEYHVWLWALKEMRTLGIPLDERVTRRFQASMRYAVDKAMRRGLRALPESLAMFTPAAA